MEDKTKIHLMALFDEVVGQFVSTILNMLEEKTYLNIFEDKDIATFVSGEQKMIMHKFASKVSPFRSFNEELNIPVPILKAFYKLWYYIFILLLIFHLLLLVYEFKIKFSKHDLLNFTKTLLKSNLEKMA